MINTISIKRARSISTHGPLFVVPSEVTLQMFVEAGEHGLLEGLPSEQPLRSSELPQKLFQAGGGSPVGSNDV